MRHASKILFLALLFVTLFLSQAQPCGPGYVTPLFDTDTSPEVPFTDYAAGNLGIVKPTFHRSVLLAAYRYIAGSGLNTAEQQAMIEVWKAEFENKPFADESIDEALKAWIAKRQEVVGKDAKTPEIYGERSYGGYEFFPNCTKNAFETAAQTLTDRAATNGPSDPGVIDWVNAQDGVFANCASGKTAIKDAPAGAPAWLQKDRAYQKAAAAFYALDYEDAKKRFAEIAADSESPWAETADYLVARTLIRQASLEKSGDRSAKLYQEAEDHLTRFVSSSGKFANSAERLLALVKYRSHPMERTSELARKLASYGGDDNFRQDVIDYDWLLDKFQMQILTAEEQRKKDEEAKKHPPDANAASANVGTSTVMANSVAAGERRNHVGQRSGDDDLEINLYAENGSWTFYVKPDATDEDAFAAAEKVIGHPLTDEVKKQVRELRVTAYAERFQNARQKDYEGGYYGEEKLRPSLLPETLRQDDLTDWLYEYQIEGPEAYLYSLNKYKQGSSDLWLMTALSKADRTSTGLPRLIEAGLSFSRTSPAWPTIAYHTARLLLETGKEADARKLVEEMIDHGDSLPISARNTFIKMRLRFSETLEDFLKYSRRKAYAFDFDGEKGTVEQFIADEKALYDPEYNKDGREAYDAQVEDQFKTEKEWQNSEMFDDDTVDTFNTRFPTVSLVDVLHSPALPEQMRGRFAIAIWTRAYLLDNMATVLTITPEVIRYRPDLEPDLSKLLAAKTQAAMDSAALYALVRNPILSPYLDSGIGKTDNDQGEMDDDDWWCAPYDTEYNDKTQSEQEKTSPPVPKFLTAAQAASAAAERKRLKEIGDAPKFLGGKVMAWAKAAPADRRVPEAIYIMIGANGWTKYGCGNDEELHDQLSAYLKRHYPASEWAAKLAADEAQR